METDLFFKNITRSDDDFMRTAASLNAQMSDYKYLDYYLTICAAVRENDVRRLSMKEIEARLDTPEKKYLFKMAQAKQIQYDALNSPGGMINGAAQDRRICPEAVDRLRMLGLWRQAMPLGGDQHDY